MKPTQFLVTALAFSTLSSAWPWPLSVDDFTGVAQARSEYLQRRQDNNNNNSQNASAPPKSTDAPASSTDNASSDTASDSSAASTTDPPSSTGSDASSATDSASSGDNKSNKSGDNTSSGGGGKNSTSVSINPSASPGSIVMISPASTAGTSAFYKVQSTLTWAWNYTQLSVTPGAIDIVATVSPVAGQPAPSPFTIATNLSVSNPQTFTWDSNDYASRTSSLPVGTYTLLIYDAGLPTYTATAAPGHLALFNQFQFGMYNGQGRTDLANPYICATCNSAMGSLLDARVLRLMTCMVGLAIASGLWFAGSWGVL